MQAAGIPANTITYSVLISAYGKGGQWEKTMTVFEDMQAAGIPALAGMPAACMSSNTVTAFSHCPPFSHAVMSALYAVVPMNVIKA
jgi:pentatricopeptide repeat protein